MDSKVIRIDEETKQKIEKLTGRITKLEREVFDIITSHVHNQHGHKV